ncbi:hypothetical protein DFH11DRAFT_1589800 [Phellopilus nigrolimitatus]|nr:hypothetical protein DFH11DRAFT_1589800 [Phellopilus nigrolimitatus]
MDAEICGMFGSLTLRGWAPEPADGQFDQSKQNELCSIHPLELSRANSGSDAGPSTEDAMMMEVTDGEGNTQFIASKDEEPALGCGLLHALHTHFAPTACSASGMRDADFNFLDAILTHREAFVAFPYGHRTCSAALTKIAFALEKRLREVPAGAADGDLSTVHSLHNEAWLMSGWYST